MELSEEQKKMIWKTAEETKKEYDRVSDRTARITYYTTSALCPKCIKSYLTLEYCGGNTGGTSLLSCEVCGFSLEERVGSHAWTREEYEEQYNKQYLMGGPAFARQWEEGL